MSFRSRIRKRINAWTLKRNGVDRDPVVIAGRRVYILPTRLGLFYSGMLFAMLIGAMNYGNNLALGLTFVLGSLALVAMHYCHRNLAGLQVSSAVTDPVFAGQDARFRIALENPSSVARHELTAVGERVECNAVHVGVRERELVEVIVPTRERGWLMLERFDIATRYPFGLFRAWVVLHMQLKCIVYPRPSERGASPPPFETDVGSAQDSRRGEDDFAGLRTYHPGDSPRQIAWKTYARGQGLHVKQYAGTAVTSYWLAWDSLPTLNTEERLSRLARWIEDAHAAGRAYGLKLPNVEIPPNIGHPHRHRCLSALALFEGRQASLTVEG
jgi:uncharacterized protein (DUF58 family)